MTTMYNYEIRHNRDTLRITLGVHNEEFVVVATRNEETHGLVLIRTYNRDEAVNVYQDPVATFNQRDADAPLAIAAGLATFH